MTLKNQKLRRWLESNPGPAMVLGGCLGLVFPYGDWLPNATISFLLAALIFLSCFRMTAPLQAAMGWRPFVFCAIRFILFPVLLWGVAHKMMPDYALGLLLLALCPAGASSAALTGIYGGNVGLGLLLTIISSLTCIVTIPWLTDALASVQVAVSPWALMASIAFCILLPAACYYALREQKHLVMIDRRHGRLMSVVLISFLIFVVVTKKRADIFAQPEMLAVPLLLACAFYGLILLISFSIPAPREDRISYGIGSTFNNNALGLSLAFLYFDATTILLLLSTEIIWASLPLFVAPAVRHITAAD